MTILIVDDEPDTRSLFAQRFRKELRDGSVAFHFAGSAEDALAILEAVEAPDLVLILSDINLPGASGLDLVRSVKEQYAQVRVYVIALSDDDGRRAMAERSGANGFLAKPLNFDELRRDILHLP